MSRDRRRWLLAYALGETAGIGVAAAAFAALSGPLDGTSLGVRLGSWTVGVAAGVVEGGALGTFTWLVLRHRLPLLRARRWIGATAAVAASCWALGMLPSTLNSTAATESGAEQAGPPGWLLVVAIPVGGIVGGALIGAAQAWALRGVAGRRGRWVVRNAMAWSVGLAVIGAVAFGVPGQWPVAATAAAGVLAGATAGSVVGAITGAALPQPVDAP